MSGKVRQFPRLEVHTHAYIGGGKRGEVEHSHDGGDRPHLHPDTGPSMYTIDKDDWFARTGLRGGGRKKFTTKPFGPQLDYVERPAEENTFRVVFVDGYTPGHAAAGISRERWESERAAFLAEAQAPAVAHMSTRHKLTPIFVLGKPGGNE